MNKPTTVPVWDSNQTAIATPPTTQQTDGVAVGDKFPAQWLNFLYYWLCQWAAYAADLTNTALVWLAAHTWQASVTTWTLVQTYSDGLGAGHAQRRLYMGTAGQIAIVRNASWNEGTTTWTADDATSSATRLVLTSAGRLDFAHHAPAASWAEAGWGTALLEVDGGGNLTILADINAANGHIRATTGDVQGIHFLGGDNAPACNPVTGVSAGVDPNSNATGGAITLSSVGGVGAGSLATVVFDSAYPTGCFASLTPASDYSSQRGLFIANRSANGFEIWSHSGIGAGATISLTYTANGY